VGWRTWVTKSVCFAMAQGPTAVQPAMARVKWADSLVWGASNVLYVKGPGRRLATTVPAEGRNSELACWRFDLPA